MLMLPHEIIPMTMLMVGSNDTSNPLSDIQVFHKVGMGHP